MLDLTKLNRKHIIVKYHLEISNVWSERATRFIFRQEARQRYNK